MQQLSVIYIDTLCSNINPVFFFFLIQYERVCVCVCGKDARLFHQPSLPRKTAYLKGVRSPIIDTR